MAGPVGIPPSILQLPITSFGGAFQPGQILSGLIRGGPENLVLLLAGRELPLDPSANFVAGQRVNVEVVRQDEGMHLRLTPQPAPAAPPPPAAGISSPAPPTSQVGAALQEMLDAVLAKLNAPDATAHANALLPRALPATENAMRQFFSALVSRNDAGADLQLLQNALSQAASSGTLSPQGAELVALVSQFIATEESHLRAVLEHLARAGRPAEARIATAMAADTLQPELEALSQEIQSRLARVREEPDLIAFLRERGQARMFEQAVGRVLERFDNAQLHNLRSFDQPYLFLQLPVPPDSGLQRAEVHFLGRREGKGGAWRRDDATVAIDLSTTRLGDLWIGIDINRGVCSCTFRAREVDAVEAIRQNAPELVQGLENAGYPNASVRVVPWQRDRLGELSRLVRPMAGLNVRG